MPSYRQTIAFCLAALAAALAPLAAGSQTPPPPSTTYRPGLGDLMTMTVQPRHLKVGLAGQQRNWTYAAYELHELEEALERVARISPKWREVDIAGLIKGSTEGPIEALEQAIKAKDVARFDAAYGQLTSACNACHQSANVGFIAIQIPRSSPFANQDFRPVNP
ncbi:MAG: cytochrome family protein [Reyranellaceae bacterium]